MSSRYYSEFKEKKVSGGGKYSQNGSSKGESMPQRQSYTGCPLPGKASNGFAEAKKGYREVNGYAAYKGLSESKGGGNTSLRQGSVRDVQRSVFESQMDLEKIDTNMARSIGRMQYGGAMREHRGNFQKAMADLTKGGKK